LFAPLNGMQTLRLATPSIFWKMERS
jgi:hypothetical protein